MFVLFTFLAVFVLLLLFLNISFYIYTMCTISAINKNMRSYSLLFYLVLLLRPFLFIITI